MMSGLESFSGTFMTLETCTDSHSRVSLNKLPTKASWASRAKVFTGIIALRLIEQSVMTPFFAPILAPISTKYVSGRVFIRVAMQWLGAVSILVLHTMLGG